MTRQRLSAVSWESTVQPGRCIAGFANYAFHSRPMKSLTFSNRQIVLDGGLATHLEDLGCDLNHRLWSARCLADASDAIIQAHRDYLLAGADVITTATYQATHQGFEAFGYSADEVDGLLRFAVALARAAMNQAADLRSGATWIAASIGPYGASLADGSEYRGDYRLSRNELIEFHDRRWRVLSECRPDVILCETIPSLVELDALLELASKRDGPPVWISLSTFDESHLADGTPLDECARRVQSAGRSVDALGVNCLPPNRVSGALDCLRTAWDGRLIAYPNSGETYNPAHKTWEGSRDPGAMADWAVRWIEQGVSVIGGCCRTTPEHIASIRRCIEAMNG